MGQITVALCALILLAVIIMIGRRDLSHPSLAFAVTWFVFVAIAQIRLTSFEHGWSAEFAVLVLAGGATFVLAAFLATGLTPARGSVLAVTEDYAGSRLMLAAGVLLAGAIAGLVWKASILGGIPLLSGDIDVLRARAYGSAGDIAVPAWSTFLTDGFHLGFWCLLAAAWCGWARSPMRRALIAGGIAVAVLGAFAGGSRNTLLFALAVPLVAVYQQRPGLSRRAIIGFAAVGAVGLLLVSSIFLIRVHQREAGLQTFLNRELESMPLLVRPVMPIYIGGTFSFEGGRQLLESDQARFSRGLGVFSLQGLPDALFPEGKSLLGDIVSNLTLEQRPAAYAWAVATYQGRAFSDFGAAGIFSISAILGLLFGGAYRLSRGRRGLLPLAVLGYCAYYSAFLFYDNLLSVAVMAVVYDLFVLAVVDNATRSHRRGVET